MLRALGLWAGIEGAAQPILQVKVSDGVAGRGAAPLFAHFDADELGEGPLGHIVEDRYLRRALLAAMAESPLVTVETGARVTGQAEVPGGVAVTLEDGSTRDARLLVGADGRGSQVARDRREAAEKAALSAGVEQLAAQLIEARRDKQAAEAAHEKTLVAARRLAELGQLGLRLLDET